jgi:xylulokinase
VILAVDIGTSTFKAALWSFDGSCLASVFLPLSLSKNGRCETDPEQWIRAFGKCCARLPSQNLSKAEVLVISGNGPTLVPVLGTPQLAGGELRLESAPARLWLDRRAAAAEVSLAVGEFVDPGFFLPKALDIKNNEPGLYEKTCFFFNCPEYLAYALTGEARTIFPSEGFDRWYWNRDILEKLALDDGKFPLFISPGDIFGTLPSGIAACFGLPAGMPVVAGGPDFFVTILGTGAVSPGQVCDRSGSSEGINVCTEKRIVDRRLMSYGHPVKPWWNLSGIISTTGKAVDWCMEMLGIGPTVNSPAGLAAADSAGHGSGYEKFYQLAEAGGPGAGGLVFLPYLAGERAPIWDSEARGVFSGLSLSSGREHIARAVAEGICLAIRDVIAVMEEAGAKVGELRVTGGTAESPVLNQIKADITGRDVLTQVHRDAGLLGLAVIGAAALGKYGSFAEAASDLVSTGKTWRPDEKKNELYGKIFTRYRESYAALKGLDDR